MSVCALRLYPATLGRRVRCGSVCVGSGFGCAPPLLAGVLGCVCVCVHAPLVPRHSWLGPAVWVCVLGLEFGLCAATPGWGLGMCVCVRACSVCTPPLLAGVCGVVVCAWARVSALLCHSWLECWAVCVCVHAPLVPCHFWPGCAVWVFVLWLGFQRRPATPGLGFGVCLCLCARSTCTGHFWLGCAVWVCVLRLRFRLARATPGSVGGLCVCLCARSTCTLPLLAGVCGVGVCAWSQVSAVPRHPWLLCWGVCVYVRAPPYPATPG